MLRMATVLSAVAVLAGCATAADPLALPTEPLWGYTAPTSSGAEELVITWDRVACNTLRARYARRAAAPVYLAECRQLTLAPGNGYWIVPAADVDGYLGALTREECEATGRRQSRDYGTGARVCQSVQVDFKER